MSVNLLNPNHICTLALWIEKNKPIYFFKKKWVTQSESAEHLVSKLSLANTLSYQSRYPDRVESNDKDFTATQEQVCLNHLKQAKEAKYHEKLFPIEIDRMASCARYNSDEWDGFEKSEIRYILDGTTEKTLRMVIDPITEQLEELKDFDFVDWYLNKKEQKNLDKRHGVPKIIISIGKKEISKTIEDNNNKDQEHQR